MRYFVKRFSAEPFVIGAVFFVGVLAGRAPADDEPSSVKAATATSTPASLEELKALEAKAVLTAQRVLLAVVGVNNSAGVIVSKDGHVLTAAHLGGLRRDSVRVRRHDGKKLNGKTLGMYGKRDAAAVKIDDEGPFPFVELGSSKDLQPGSWCLLFGHMQPAIAGRPPVLRLARVREVTAEKVITQCTATGGDSGGPLFDLEGKLIGINSYGLPGQLGHVPIEVFKDNWKRLLGGERWGGSPRIVRTINLQAGAPPRLRPAPVDRGHGLVRPLAKKAEQSVVRVLCDGKETCLGTVVSADGLIATKASELSGAITCRLADGKELEARRVRTVEQHDLAFLRVESKSLVPVRWAERQRVEIGRWVVTVGPSGELRGVGVLGVTRLAVPLQIPNLGAQFGSNAVASARIESVTPRTPAADAGLQPGDVIVAVDEKKTPTLGEVLKYLSSRPSDSEVRLRVARGKKTLDKPVRLASPSGPRIVRRGLQGGGVIIMRSPRVGRSSASKRQNGFPLVFQHDASLWAADCGSPLIGLDGKALGINIACTSGPAKYGLPAQIIAAEADRLSDAKTDGKTK